LLFTCRAVTICPDAALGRYAGQKSAKYRGLCRHVQQSVESSLHVDLPAVIALGLSGGVPPSTRSAFAHILGILDETPSSGDDEYVSSMEIPLPDMADEFDMMTTLPHFMAAAREIAMSRADAPKIYERQTRRERRRSHR